MRNHRLRMKSEPKHIMFFYMKNCHLLSYVIRVANCRMQWQLVSNQPVRGQIDSPARCFADSKAFGTKGHTDFSIILKHLLCQERLFCTTIRIMISYYSQYAHVNEYLLYLQQKLCQSLGM